jgi:hypothetical protein
VKKYITLCKRNPNDDDNLIVLGRRKMKIIEPVILIEQGVITVDSGACLQAIWRGKTYEVQGTILMPYIVVVESK